MHSYLNPVLFDSQSLGELLTHRHIGKLSDIVKGVLKIVQMIVVEFNYNNYTYCGSRTLWWQRFCPVVGQIRVDVLVRTSNRGTCVNAYLFNKFVYSMYMYKSMHVVRDGMLALYNKS